MRTEGRKAMTMAEIQRVVDAGWVERRRHAAGA